MSIITQPFSFWRIFQKVGILKFGFDFVILNRTFRYKKTHVITYKSYTEEVCYWQPESFLECGLYSPEHSCFF